MCMCGKPVINGQPGYSWNGNGTSVYPVNPPELKADDTLIYDEPGRCGGLDSHCHHFRLVKDRWGDVAILVRHGGGDERFSIAKYMPGMTQLLAAMERQDTNGRYWFMHLLHSIHHNAESAAKSRERGIWAMAAIEKRIKVRRRNGQTRAEIVTSPAIAGV